MLGADAPLLQGVELRKQLLGIQHHAVADHADRALEDSRGDLVQDERLALPRVDGVAGIRAALIAHHEIRALRQDVDDLPLAFIAPLGADHDDALDLGSEQIVLAGTRQSAEMQKLDARLFQIVQQKKAPRRGP